jgi:hypothetical protein
MRSLPASRPTWTARPSARKRSASRRRIHPAPLDTELTTFTRDDNSGAVAACRTTPAAAASVPGLAPGGSVILHPQPRRLVQSGRTGWRCKRRRSASLIRAAWIRACSSGVSSVQIWNRLTADRRASLLWEIPSVFRSERRFMATCYSC